MLNSKLNRKLKLILCTCLMSFILIICGASFVFSSILLAKLKETTSPIHVNSEDASWIASVPLLICPTGLLIIGILTDKIGRRKALQIAYLPFILSWLILAYADSLKAIIIGRILSGTTMGCSGTVTYLYVAEICPTKYRPLYFSVLTLFVGGGMMLECILAMYFHWHTVSVILFAMSVAGCASLFFVPESPMWLRANGRVREAEAAEKWLGMDAPGTATAVAGPDADGDPDANRGNDADGDPDGLASVPYWKMCSRPTVWKPALLTVSFFVCQQLSGFYVLLFYSVDVLHDCHVPWDGITVTVFLSISRVVGSVIFSILHRVKRKTLLVVSSVGMASALIYITVHMRTYKDVPEPPYGTSLIFAFVMYVFFALLAILPLPWALCGEVFPMAIKGTMNGIVQVFGYELMFIVIKIYPSMVSKFGIEDVWSLFAGVCVANAFFGAFIMPETKGKTLNEILASFKSPQKSLKNPLP